MTLAKFCFSSFWVLKLCLVRKIKMMKGRIGMGKNWYMTKFSFREE